MTSLTDGSRPPRPPAIAAEAMVATSQPLATRAGLRALERGGTAADAAIAAAAMLCVTEPPSTGVGGDAFAVVYQDGDVIGLDAAGPAPRSADPEAPVETRGPRSVTVPGAVAGWDLLAGRYGRLGLDACLADAIDAASHGVAIGARTAAMWGMDPRCPPEFGPAAPSTGERFRAPALAATLRAIAAGGAAAFYRGALAEAIAAACWLTEDDLDAFEAAWVEPLRLTYRGYEVVELPPPTQGVAALEALGLLADGGFDLVHQVACAALAMEDAFTHVRDGADVEHLLSAGHLAKRRLERADAVDDLEGGTVYLCAVDADGMAVSLIQSVYQSFGSGVLVPGTGIVLQNRGAGFALDGRVTAGKRAYHTIIPGLLHSAGGDFVAPFGICGGTIQPQAHMQFVSALLDQGLDPQEALDRPRFRLGRDCVLLEQGLWSQADELTRRGYAVVRETDPVIFGNGQAIVRHGGFLTGGSDSRVDGYAAGF